MNSTRWGRALVAAAVLASAAMAAPGAASAGQYPMYAGDVPGVNLSAPSQAAWTFWDTSGQIRRANTFPTQTTGASVQWKIGRASCRERV